MLGTKCIKANREVTDGTRISVMSRHTLNDGVTPDQEIRPALYDLWLPELAPPPCLVGAYYKRGIGWEEFSDKYLNYIQISEIEEKAILVAETAMHENITLLCIEERPEQCHRRLLANRLEELRPGLIIAID